MIPQVIHWLICPADECPAVGAERPPDFLSEPERETFARLRFPKRRREWLLGRWTAKCLLQRSQAAYQTLPLDAITVGNDPDGAPYLCIDGEGRLSVSLSISHRDDRAFCALSSASIGADIERVEPRAPAFVHDFFTSGEAGRIWASSPSLRDTLVTVLWSAKEAALKALHQGLRVDTRHIEIRRVAGIEGVDVRHNPASEAWHAVEVRSTLPGTLPIVAWWRSDGDYVLTLAATMPISASKHDCPGDWMAEFTKSLTCAIIL